MDSKQEAMLKDIQAIDVYLYDLVLFLDTHPCDKEALAVYRKYNEQAKAMRKRYEDLYGPLTITYAEDENYWQWVGSPWPWERQGG